MPAPAHVNVTEDGVVPDVPFVQIIKANVVLIPLGIKALVLVTATQTTTGVVLYVPTVTLIAILEFPSCKLDLIYAIVCAMDLMLENSAILAILQTQAVDTDMLEPVTVPANVTLDGREKDVDVVDSLPLDALLDSSSILLSVNVSAQLTLPLTLAVPELETVTLAT